VLLCNIYVIQSFNIFKATTSNRAMSIMMGGGRSPAETEAKSSKRKMFQDLRQKLNTAAEIPGFFEVGDGAPDVQLFCKSNKDGTQIGDCPFAQFIQMVLMKKGVKYTTFPTLSNEKPEWLTSKHEGRMPALMHKDTSMVDSLAIAEYLEKSFPHTTLTKQGAFSYQEVLEKTSGFFPALSAYIKNTDDGKDAELLTAVNNQLDIIDEVLRSAPGKFLCGMDLTLADLYLLPQLFHAMVTMNHFKEEDFYNVSGDSQRPALESYLARMLDLEEFNDKRVYCNADTVIYGWKVARGEA